jgi:hypothetical protein
MRVIRHAVRYLINVSHPEMEALREIVERGLIDLADDPDPPLSTSARKSLAYWLPKTKGKRPRNPLREKKATDRARTAKTAPGGKDTPEGLKRLRAGS